MPLHDTTPQDAPLKRCGKCEQLFPATTEYFHKHTRNDDGLRRVCKQCRAASEGFGYKAPARSGFKFCLACKQELPATSEFFYKQSARVDGLQVWCKACKKQHEINTREAASKRRKRHYEANKERINEYQRNHRKANRDVIIQRERQHRETNKVEIATRRRAYVQQNWEKIYQASEKRRQQDPEKYAEYKRKSYQNNKAAYDQRAREWRHRNKERMAERNKRWRAKYPAANRIGKMRRRALERNAIGDHTAADIRRQYKAQKGKCYYCNVKVGKTYHVDHVIPLSRGGSNGPENIVIACAPCNLSKHDKLPTEWIGSNRLL